MIKQIKVRVTKADLQEGIATSCEMCPVALALKRVLSVRPIWVGVTHARLGPWFAPVSIALPAVAVAAIEQLVLNDSLQRQGRPRVLVQPFSFELEVNGD